MHTSLFQARLRGTTSVRPQPQRGVVFARRSLCVTARAGGYNEKGARQRAPNQPKGKARAVADDDDDDIVAEDDDDEVETAQVSRYRRPAVGDEEEAPPVVAAPPPPARSYAAQSPASGSSSGGASSSGSSSSSGRAPYGGSTASREGGGSSYAAGGGASSYPQRSGGGSSYQSDRPSQNSGGGSAQSSGGGGGGGGDRRYGSAPPTWRASAQETPEILARQDLKREISAAKDWRGLATILAEKGHIMDNTHVTTILQMVSEAERPLPEDEAGRAEFEAMLSALYGWTAQLLPLFTPSNAAAGIVAVAMLEYFNTELVTGLCSSVLTGMGNLSVGLGGEFDNEYYNILWALGQMNFSPGHEWLQQFDMRTQRKLDQFRWESLCDSFTLLAKLGHQPTPAWMTALGAALKYRQHKMNHTSLIQLLTGAANVRASGGIVDSAWLDQLIGTGFNISTMYSASLREVVWAITQLDYQPQPSVLVALATAYNKQHVYLSPADSCTMAYSMAYLKVTPSPAVVDFLQRLLDRSYATLTGDELAYMTAALAAFGLRPRDKWMDDLLLEADRKMSQCSGPALAMLADALPLMSSGRRLSMCVEGARARLAAMQAAEAAPQYAEEPAAEDNAPQ